MNITKKIEFPDIFDLTSDAVYMYKIPSEAVPFIRCAVSFYMEHIAKLKISADENNWTELSKKWEADLTKLREIHCKL